MPRIDIDGQVRRKRINSNEDEFYALVLSPQTGQKGSNRIKKQHEFGNKTRKEGTSKKKTKTKRDN